MPQIIDQPIEGYAHCLNARCPGYAQEPVKALRRETGFTYIELNGTAEESIPGFERSTVSFVFADEDEASCPSCGGPREISTQPRVDYQSITASGRDPLALLQMRPGGVPDVAAIEAENAALRAKLEGQAA